MNLKSFITPAAVAMALTRTDRRAREYQNHNRTYENRKRAYQDGNRASENRAGSCARPRDGGITFGLDPGDADVYVDDQYVGNARDFSGAAQPLTLAAGMHRIELPAPGYEPVVFDVNVVPGQVVPYQGGMLLRY
jgi:hypothetical protein